MEIFNGSVDKKTSLPGINKNLIKSLVPIVKGFGAIYFQFEIQGLEHIPLGPCLIVGNHNAGVTSFDPFFFGAEYYKNRGYEEQIFALTHDVILNFPVLGNLISQLGAIPADYSSATSCLCKNQKVLVYPGGNREAFRPYSQRFKINLAEHRGFIRLALECQVPIVPMVHIGGHETFCVLHSGESVAKILRLNKWLRSSTFPIILGLPWGICFGPMFHIPIPVKFSTQIGQPINLSSMGYTPGDANNEEKISKIYNMVSETMQNMMDQLRLNR